MYCSFCGRGRDEVGCLVSGPDAFICEACVALCRDVLANNHPERSASTIRAFDRAKVLALAEALAESVQRSLAAHPAITRVPAWAAAAKTAMVALHHLAAMITAAHFADYRGHEPETLQLGKQ